jgi:hypothetical protein
MPSPYDRWIEQVKNGRAKGFPTEAEQRELASILFPVLDFFRALEDESLVSDCTQEYPIQGGIACACRISSDNWIVAHCLLPIIENQAVIRVGKARQDKKIIKATWDSKPYPPAKSPEEVLKTHWKLLDHIASLASETT